MIKEEVNYFLSQNAWARNFPMAQKVTGEDPQEGLVFITPFLECLPKMYTSLGNCVLFQVYSPSLEEPVSSLSDHLLARSRWLLPLH